MNSGKGFTDYLSYCIRTLAIAFVFAFVFIVTGCAINSTEPQDPVIVSESDSLVALDFVNIMTQIEALSPGSTVLRFGVEEGNASDNDDRSVKTSAAFGKALRAEAIKSGYALETVSSPTGDNFVSFAVTEFGDAVDGTTYTYDVSVGNIDFRRVYKPLENGGVAPINSMLIRGVDVSRLVTDDSLFANSAGEISTDDQTSIPATDTADTDTDTDAEQLPAIQALEADDNELSESVARDDEAGNQQTGPAVFERPVTIAAPLISDLPEPTFEDSLEVGGDLSTGFETIRKINIAVSGESNYESLLADKEDIAAEVLIFGNDSYVLGSRNKQTLTKMMEKFNPDTDVVSVVGCSTGITKIENGNAALAIGRANRVKEALLYSGIPHDKIYDEGCWSATANSTPFPNRGVVVTVKRQAGNG